MKVGELIEKLSDYPSDMEILPYVTIQHVSPLNSHGAWDVDIDEGFADAGIEVDITRLPIAKRVELGEVDGFNRHTYEIVVEDVVKLTFVEWREEEEECHP